MSNSQPNHSQLTVRLNATKHLSWLLAYGDISEDFWVLVTSLECLGVPLVLWIWAISTVTDKQSEYPLIKFSLWETLVMKFPLMAIKSWFTSGIQSWKWWLLVCVLYGAVVYQWDLGSYCQGFEFISQQDSHVNHLSSSMM